jgi:hypothetical protein
LYAEGLIIANVKDLPILRDDEEEEEGIILRIPQERRLPASKRRCRSHD